MFFIAVYLGKARKTMSKNSLEECIEIYFFIEASLPLIYVYHQYK